MGKAIVIGGGLAGSEAAYHLLRKGHEVHLYEPRPAYRDEAHETPLFGELVCSNSLKSKRIDNACGLLKEEMRLFGSIMMEAADHSEVPSGNALGVDRNEFAGFIDAKLRSFPNLVVHNEEVRRIPEDGLAILATGPLTSPELMSSLEGLLGKSAL